MRVLGLNLFHSDASAALIENGEVVFAVAEERLNRVKHFAGVPVRSIRACLDAAGVEIGDLDHVAVGRDARANRGKKVRYALAHPQRLPNLIGMRGRREGMDDLRTLLAEALEVDAEQVRCTEHHVEHHLAHVASAYYCSGWERAAGFSCDGSGDFVSAMLARCEGNEIEVLERVFLPHSLGSFYTMICDFIGYRKYGDEGKVMGLAALGSDIYDEQIRDVVAEAGEVFKLNLDYFRPLGANAGMQINERGEIELSRHFSDKMVELFGEPREPGSEITPRDMDLAFSMQRRFEEMYFHLLRTLHDRVGGDAVAMAGGSALNSVANGKIFDETPFRRTWIQPAAGDEGLAIGAALYAYHAILGGERPSAPMAHAYLGPEFSPEEMRAALDAANLEYAELDRAALLDEVSGALAEGKVIGWFQGRTEWGPRALGNRSIVAHPGYPGMKDTLNARIKHRESFRPFAPSILAEYQSEYFEHDHPTPFMLHVYKIRAEHREALSAVNHVDDTGRLQTVSRSENPLYYDLIDAFRQRTGLPVVLNTSFNENEPIVCRPQEAVDCFVRTKMDVLALGPFLSRGSGETQPPA